MARVIRQSTRLKNWNLTENASIFETFNWTILIYVYEIHLHGLVTFLQSQEFHHIDHQSIINRRKIVPVLVKSVALKMANKSSWCRKLEWVAMTTQVFRKGKGRGSWGFFPSFAFRPIPKRSYQRGTPTWRPFVNQANICNSSFPIVQPPNALSLPNFDSRYISPCQTYYTKMRDAGENNPSQRVLARNVNNSFHFFRSLQSLLISYKRLTLSSQHHNFFIMQGS